MAPKLIDQAACRIAPISRTMSSSERCHQTKTFKCRRKMCLRTNAQSSSSCKYPYQFSTSLFSTSFHSISHSSCIIFAILLSFVLSPFLVSQVNGAQSNFQSDSAWNIGDEASSGRSSSSDTSGQMELIFSVSEGVPVGTYIGVIKSNNASLVVEPPFLIVPVPGGEQHHSPAPSSVKAHHNHHGPGVPPYAINLKPTPSGTVDTDLNIDQSTGEIRTAIELDREQRSHYSFVAISLTGVNILVKIVIEDVNDNSPHFPTDRIELDFPENSKPKEVKRTLPPARDADRGVFGTQSYRIVSGNVRNAFRLVSHREKDEILYLDLQVNGALDRENISNYQLVIEALDGGQPPLKAQMTVQISILDHNDCEPIFSQSHYYGSVPENVTLGSSVLKVTATDSDEGENGQIVYSLYTKNVQSGGTSASNYFAINRSTGWIYVSKPLDFESQELHELVVIARDQGAQPLETSAFVSIRVTDVNDNQPTINLLFLTENSKPEISEDAKVGDLIARISVNDADAIDSFSQRHRFSSSGSSLSSNKRQQANRLSVSLLGANDEFGLRTQDQIVYLIVVTGKLDREKRSKYSLTVVVTDKGTPPLNTTTTFELDILDVNDNAPHFESNVYHTTLPEAADIGSSVFQMNAIDLDSDSLLTYAFVVSRNGYDDANSDNDGNSEESDVLSATTSDETSETYFVNYFNRHNTTHRLTSRTNWFSIDRRSGLIVTRTQVDCEADSEPRLTILVTDSVPFVNAPRRDQNGHSTKLHHQSTFNGFTATATLVIAISDINDNEPVFDQSFYNVTVREDESVGVCILHVAATDPDCGVNALVNYSFASTNLVPYLYHSTSSSSSLSSPNSYRLSAAGGNRMSSIQKYPQSSSSSTSSSSPSTASTTFSNQQQADFTLDPKSGQLCIARTLDFERTSVYDIPVLATDRGGLSTTAMVKIQVIDTNDNYPVFYPREYKVNVQLNAFETNRGERVPLVIVAATDLDSPNQSNGQIRYSIQSGNEKGLFEVEPRTGELFLVRPFKSSDQQQQYRLNMVARDGGGLESKESALVQISVLPPDTESRIAMPTFVQRQFAFQVIENVAQGSPVGTVRARIEGAPEQPISYAIYSGDPDGYFSIDPRLGTISVKSPNIDAEKYSHLLLNVQAYTGEYPGPYRYAHTQVNITILDENDNVPLFPSSSLKISIPENLPVDNSTPILVAYAVDYDSGKFGQIRYSLYRADGHSPHNSDSDFPFVIDEKSGHVLLRRVLDYETRNEYKVRVVAIDGGQLSSEMLVDIFVQDANDNAPVFVGTAQTIDLSHFGFPAQVVPLFRVNVPENVQVSSHFYQIKATDADTGNNARLTYSLASLGNDTAASTLPIDIFPNNGVLYVKDALDRESVDRYEMLVRVHDHGLPQPFNATAVLRVVVGDVNDNRPYWRQSSYSFEVPEDASIGTLLGQVDAFDVDLQGNSTLQYNITDSPDSSVIRINPGTGQIYLRATLDRELKDRYEFAVEVRDQGVPTSLTSEEKAVVTLTVRDINDNRPVFDFDGLDNDYDDNDNQNVVKVPLGTVRKSIVASFKATDPDEGVNGTVRYSLTEESELFELDSETGALITKVDIKESHKRLKMVKISLVASDGQGKKSKVKMADVEFVDKRTIAHVNLDNVQTFNFVMHQSHRATESFSYGHRVGSIELPSRSSSTSNRNSHQLFCGNRLFNNFNRQLKEGIPFFVDSDEDDPKKLNLFLSSALNESSSATLFNLLLCIDWSQCSATLLQNHQEKLSHQQHNHNHPMPQCDYYAKVNVELQRASNLRCNPFPLDNNDLYEVKIPWIGGGDSGSGSSVGKRRVNELIYLNQSQCNDQVQYELSSPMMDEATLARLFTITPADRQSPSTLQFRPHEKSLIHRYLHQDFVLSLTARWKVVQQDQQQTTEMTQSVPVRVKILSSDNQIGNIVFMNEKFLELEEDCCRVGAAIVQARINVSHDDFRIRYFLASYGDQHLVSGDDQFTLNPDSGLLLLKRELDFERKHEHRINITAVVYDSKSPIMSVSHIVKIRIVNTNDEAPVFLRRTYEKEVLENVRPGLLLVQVEAKDSDQPVQANITYVLPQSYQYAEYFQLNHRNGELHLAKELDREEIEHFNVPVYAFDEDFQHYALTLVHVKVLDINDNPPYFIQSSFELKVPESIMPGTVVYNLIALDPDLSSSLATNYSTTTATSLQYRIVSGNVASKFVLHPNRGELSTNALLDREMQSSYQLVIEVSDSFYSTNCNVSIELTDVNDNAPIFDKSDYYAILDLDGTFGWLSVVTVRAIDSDGDKLLYTIDTNQSNEQNSNLTRYFTIKSETGEISIHRSLVGPIFDLVHSNQFSFEVIAIEAGKSSYQSHRSRARVHLTLVNDGRNAPAKLEPNGIKFAKYPYVIIADAPRESFRIGQEIANIEFSVDSNSQATSGLKSKSSSSYQFRVLHGGESYRSFNDYFHLNAQSGLITVKRPLAYNYFEAFVELAQNDQSKEHMNTQTLVQIFVGGIDDRKFVKSIHLNQISVVESQPLGSEIINLASYLHAYGAHKHRFILAYSNLADYQQFFELDSNAGVVKLKRSLDYETQPNQIELIAFAYRPSGALYEEGCLYNVTIDLVNVDDNRAQFTQSHYVGTIREGDPTGSYVARVNAIDIDEVNVNFTAMLQASDKRYSYFIVDGNDDNAFSVGVDGIVRTNIVLDREIHDRYRLKIIATDMKQQEELASGWSASFLSDEANYQHLTQCTLEVIVIDQNDNVPVFPPYKEISVSEDAQVGSVVATWTANDVDIYPTLSYSKRKPASNNITIIEDLFDIGLYTGKIFLKSSLKPLLAQTLSDQSNSHVRIVQLSISASDQIHSVDTDIIINIKRNQSTMMPQFKKSDGNFYLKLNLDSEHSQLLHDTNVEIFRVPIIEEQSRKVIFSLENMSPDSNVVDSGFYIDQNRGIIYNNRTMRSVRSSKLFHLTVVARYQDSDRFSQALLLINMERSVGSLGYHHYKKDSVGSSSNGGAHNHYSLDIESSQIGVPLLRLPKQQLDSYVIVGGNTNKNFLILRGNELVLVSRPLTDQYSLKIKPMRSANSKRTNTTSFVHIKIRASTSADGFSVSPFKSSIFEIEISENDKVDSEIQSLKVGSKTEKFKFAIFSGNEQDMFKVDSDTGALSIGRQLDFEQTSTYRLGVLAQSDSGSTYFSIANINLINANEFCPRFPSAHFKAIVDENSPPGTKVLPIRAIDRDNDLLNYTVVKLTSTASDSSDLVGPFRYDTDSGYLVTTGQLDYEQQVGTHHQSSGNSLAIYKFVVRVLDMNTNIYSGNSVDLQCGSVETLLEVQIGSVDEFVPQFNSESYQFKVSTLTDAPASPKSRLKIGQVSAVDADVGPDGIVMYSIKSASPAHLLDLLQINSTSGLITMSLAKMKKKMAIKKNAIPKQFSLIVSASSGRINSFSSLTMVDVQLSMVDHADGFIDITEDEEIEEINSIDSDLSRSDGTTRKEASLPGWLIFLTVLLFLVMVVLLVSIVVIRMHQNQQQQLMSGHFGGPGVANMGSLFRKIGPGPNGIEANGISPAYSAGHYGTTTMSGGPPCYNDVTLGQSNGLMPINMEGHSASSGRGSAEDDDADLDDVDEEIRMINESSNYYTEGPDSGGEEITTTAEYLARLGVSNHYEEEQENNSSIAIDDDDDESTDVLSEMGVSKMNARYGGIAMGTKKLRSRMGSSISTTGTIVNNNRSSSDQWPHGGSLNSIIQHNEEELSGSYNWDYLQHWGPKYQPLSSVFAEIAKLKSDPSPVQTSQSVSAELLESMSNRSTTSTVSSRTRGLRQQQQQQMHQQQVPSQQQQPPAHVPAPAAPNGAPLPQTYYPQYQYSLQPQQTPSSLSNYSIYGMTNMANIASIAPNGSSVAAPPPPGSSTSSSIYNRNN